MKRIGLTLKITLLFLLFAVVLVAGVGFLSYRSGRSALQEAILSDLLSVAIEKQAALQEWLEERQTDLFQIAASPTFQKDLAALIPETNPAIDPDAHDRVVEALRPWIRKRHGFFSLFIMDPETGKIIVATDASEEGKFKENRPYFIHGRKAPYIQSPYYSLQFQAPALTISTPLLSPDGQLLGVLAGRLNLESLNDIFQRHSDLRQTTDAFLVNSSNLFVTQPRFLTNPAILRRGLHNETTEQCLAGHSGALFTTDYREIPVIAVYRWVAPYRLCMIVTMEQGEAFAFVRPFRRAILLTGSVVLLIASILAFGLARTITRPILALQTVARRFAQGELEIRLPKTSEDELGLLAREFNRMAGALQRELAERRQIEEALETQIARLHNLAYLNQLISSSLDMQEVLYEIARAAATLMEAPLAGFWVADEATQTLELRALSDEVLGADFPIKKRRFGESVVGWVAMHRQPLHLPNVFQDERFTLHEWVRAHRFTSAFALPVISKETLLAVLAFNGEKPFHITAEKERLLQNFVTQAAIALENARLFQEVQEQAVQLAKTNATLQKEIRERLWAEQELRKAHAELERRVQERTAELAKANETLHKQIAEHKRVAEILRQTTAKLARSNAELEQFAYVASHDLQEPLRKITNFSQLLAERYHGRLDRKAETFMAYIVDGALRMQGLIKDLLTYSRLGRGAITFEPTDMEQILRQVLADLESGIQESNATITTDSLPVVQAVPSQMRQLLQNLLSNALKFRSDHPLQIHVGVKRQEESWVFSIQDNGIGIDPQYSERIFVVFQRLHTRTEYPGTGIGLAICKKIVELHGGHIWVESTPGQGATFYFTLPADLLPS